MSENLKSYLPILKVISEIKSKKDRVVVLNIFSKKPSFVKAIKEIAVNTVNKNIQLDIKQKKSLRKHKEALVKLSNRGGKQVVLQNGGGFLPILLPIVSTILTSMLNGSD